MSTFKKCKVLLIPTNEKATRKSDLAINENNLLFQPSKLEGTWFFLNKFQHVYILSDEEIKEGDWCYDQILNIFFQADEFTDYKYINQTDVVLKIIATTDKSLGLPQPSQSFIQKYVEEYNKGNIITEVMVEYEGGCENYKEGICKEPCDNPFCRMMLKVNPKDNTITIKKVKDSWSREDEDLRIAFEKFACAVYDENYNKDMSFKKRSELMSKKWIKENL